MSGAAEDLASVRRIIGEELRQPLFPAAAAAAGDIRALHQGAVAQLFYGSCLRDGSDGDRILDYYVLVDDLGRANGGPVLGFLNRILPPNVFYRETRFDGRTVRSKYALMSLDGFVDAMGEGHLNPSFWARFTQPCALAWARDDRVAAIVEGAVTRAVVTAAGAAGRALAEPLSADELWSGLFRMTYGAELRSENASTKGAEIFAEFPERYRMLTLPALRAAGIDASAGQTGSIRVPVSAEARRREARRWRCRRVQGKTLSVLRLVKGAFTFKGGLDYLAWKIRRHSGVSIQISPWQRRHPIIGGLYLMMKTRRSGAYR
ncbi:MAG: hypothetical protein GC201_14630 [Alphaproteobacteria bacterium]|nr:hypothetical protein [Alphaproteobacteria bacterium]